MPALLASKSIVEAGKRPITRSVNDLLGEYELERDSLSGVGHILKVLKHYEVTFDPAFEDEGNLNFSRTLKAERADGSLRSEIDKLIDCGGEEHGVELKSSIRIDRKKKVYNPDIPIKDCISQRLEVKVAQEVCAFLNRDGGVMYFGIANNNEICGCKDDLDLFDSDGVDKDKADLLLRKIIERYFLNANKVLSHVVMDFVDYDGLPVVILRIAKCEKLVFLKKDCGSSSQLYVRIGTSAQPVIFEEIEDYYSVTRK